MLSEELDVTKVSIVKLSQGYSMIVDKEDYYLFSEQRWKILRSRKRVYGARTIKTGGEEYTALAHRIIMKAAIGDYVDHINGDTLDNRKSNLRLCTNGQNLHNRPRPKSGKEKYKGLQRYARGFRARIGSERVKYFSNEIFPTEEEAAKFYDLAALELVGEFATLNFPNLLEEYKLIKFSVKDNFYIEADRRYDPDGKWNKKYSNKK